MDNINWVTVSSNITHWYNAKFDTAKNLRINRLARELGTTEAVSLKFARYVVTRCQPKVGCDNPLHQLKLWKVWEEFNYDGAIQALIDPEYAQQVKDDRLTSILDNLADLDQAEMIKVMQHIEKLGYDVAWTI